VFALILYLSVVGMGLFAFVSWLQRRVVFWQKDRVAGAGGAE
jgi:NitT/TauT family transport system permease protein